MYLSFFNLKTKLRGHDWLESSAFVVEENNERDYNLIIIFVISLIVVFAGPFRNLWLIMG